MITVEFSFPSGASMTVGKLVQVHFLKELFYHFNGLLIHNRKSCIFPSSALVHSHYLSKFVATETFTVLVGRVRMSGI